MENTETLVQPATARLRLVQQTLRDEGSSDIADRIEDLMDRLVSPNRHVFVAFCGLFSAGKSSLLNALCEADVLATGAVPTTAQTHELVLPGTSGNVIMIDTPGVDSTDAAHQQETESALHRADLIVLVMDYQHVESEANLELARRFTERSQRFVLVVNQVDKHLEWELPFQTFEARVQQTLSDWDIQYEQLFYTSTDFNAEHNQIRDFYSFLKQLETQSEEIAQTRIADRLRDLVTEHVSRTLEEERITLEDELVLRIGYVPFDNDEAEALIEERSIRLNDIQNTCDARRQSVVEWFDARRTEFMREVELAQIAPYETTERGRMYVESLRSDFKIGWIRSKQKTEEEQSNRLQAFVTDIGERAEKYLLWPLQNKLRDCVKNSEWGTADWQRRVDGFVLDVTPELCKENVKHGALVSSEYPYQYVKDVMGAIKRQVTGQVNRLVEDWSSGALQDCESQLTPLLEEQQLLTNEVQLISRWMDLDRVKRERISSLVK